MAATSHKFQAPKGTRDFYPPEMAVRRHLEGVWRQSSVTHGFEEMDGPTFEHLELYTVKSGPGIVSELFSFRRAGGDTDYALRPEFTPTLARMVAARGAQLPKPIKWFSIPTHFRAERPQRGRLREFVQWNVDLLGEPSIWADIEIIAVAADMLRRIGLTPADVQIRISDRSFIHAALTQAGIPEDRWEATIELIDRHDRLPKEELSRQSEALGVAGFMEKVTDAQRLRIPFARLLEPAVQTDHPFEAMAASAFRELGEGLRTVDLLDWCEFDFSIVRGLAYYTGTVFEIHEVTGQERAIAGGGRYDNLVELFGGPPTPAVGFAMGDVVIRLVLEDRGLLDLAESYVPRPDAFVINAREEGPEVHLLPLVASLRRQGFHARHSYRSTRNLGKLLGDADKVRSRFAIILGQELASGVVLLKDLASGEQEEVALTEITEALAARLAARA